LSTLHMCHHQNLFTTKNQFFYWEGMYKKVNFFSDKKRGPPKFLATSTETVVGVVISVLAGAITVIRLSAISTTFPNSLPNATTTSSSMKEIPGRYQYPESLYL